jgi:thymidylate synthase (FAD)
MEAIKCLDHGHVKLVDVMGNDATIVAAARNSVDGLGVQLTSDERTLIRFLMRHRHTTPFEAVVFTVQMKIPIFVARQLVRHRTQSLNELSARYSELPEEYYVPLPENINLQADKNKQGRNDEVMEDADHYAKEFRNEAAEAFTYYQGRLADGMARELARINLPLSTYTQWWSTMSLHNAFHMLGLRKDAHAQFETRVFADAIGEIIRSFCPLAYEAFEDYRLNAMTFSATELKVLRGVMSAMSVDAIATLISAQPNFSKRERDEFIGKLKKLVA